MEYVEGEALDEHLKKIHFNGNMAESRIREIIEPVLKGLIQVHKAGLLHRDIKPSNIYLQSSTDASNEHGNNPMLIDFGAARQSVGEKSKSISAIISQGYAPPEQYTTRGKQGPYTDIYAICAVMYYLVSGDKPVESTDRQHQIMDDEADPLTPLAVSDEYSESFITAINQGLILKPKARTQNVAAMLSLLANNVAQTLLKSASDEKVEQDATQRIERVTQHAVLENNQNTSSVNNKEDSSNRTMLWSVLAVVLISVAIFFLLPKIPKPQTIVEKPKSQVKKIIEQPVNPNTSSIKKNIKLETDIDKQTYSIGASVGDYLLKEIDKNKQVGVFLDKASIISSFKASLLKKPLLDEATVKKLLSELEDKKINQSSAALSEDMTQYSRALGVSIGNYFKTTLGEYNKLMVELDTPLIIRGLTDGITKKRLLTMTEIKANLANFDKTIKAKQKEYNANESKRTLKEGQEFLKSNANKAGVNVTKSGLQYKILRKGTGSKPKASDTVEVHYKGTLINGEEFDSSYKRGAMAKFSLNSVIPGWTEGLQLMSEGGKFIFFIPTHLAYGEKATGPISANSTLIFEVELFSVEK
jgi:FKBP-type peptidyl-prolyl cis-trans isomerase FkpA